MTNLSGSAMRIMQGLKPGSTRQHAEVMIKQKWPVQLQKYHQQQVINRQPGSRKSSGLLNHMSTYQESEPMIHGRALVDSQGRIKNMEYEGIRNM
eukprot:11925598-Prorocentrum_lima.AAC.1